MGLTDFKNFLLSEITFFAEFVAIFNGLIFVIFITQPRTQHYSLMQSMCHKWLINCPDIFFLNWSMFVKNSVKSNLK